MTKERLAAKRYTIMQTNIRQTEIRPLRANHLTVETLPQILVGIVSLSGHLVLASPDSRGTPTRIRSGILTVK